MAKRRLSRSYSPLGRSVDTRRVPEGCRARGNGFFAITDHNTWTYPEFDLPDHVSIIAGVEVTMEFGHFNVFSEDGREPGWLGDLAKPWALRDADTAPGASRELLSIVRRSGLRISINHPLSYPWEWMDPDTSLSDVRFLEIWNDPAWPENRLNNPATVDMWTRWLNAGSRATAIGGSDFHTPEDVERYDGRVVPCHRVGVPATYVLANRPDPSSLLEAVDARRAYVTMGPTVDFAARAGSRHLEIGDDVGLFEGRIELSLMAVDPGWLVVELVRDGEVVAEASGRGSTGLDSTQTIGEAEAGWMRMDVRTRRGELVAATNPIFYGPRPGILEVAYGSFIRDSALDLIAAFHEPSK